MGYDLLFGVDYVAQPEQLYWELFREVRLYKPGYAIIPDLDVLAMEITPDSSAQCLAPEGDTVRRE